MYKKLETVAQESKSITFENQIKVQLAANFMTKCEDIAKCNRYCQHTTSYRQTLPTTITKLQQVLLGTSISKTSYL